VSRYGRPCDPQARPVGVGEHPQEDDIDQRDEQQDAPPSAVARLVQNLDDRQQINQQDDKTDNPMHERYVTHLTSPLFQGRSTHGASLRPARQFINPTRD
jgi:hypothetical protein